MKTGKVAEVSKQSDYRLLWLYYRNGLLL